MEQRQVRPLWQGVPRGAAIATMKVLDPPPADGRSLPEKLLDRLVHAVSEPAAAVIGLLITLGWFSGGIVAFAAVPSPVGVALLSLSAIAWFAACIAAALRVEREGAGAPAWAKGIVLLLVVIGRFVVITAIVVSVVVILYLVLAILVGAGSAGRSG